MKAVDRARRLRDRADGLIRDAELWEQRAARKREKARRISEEANEQALLAIHRMKPEGTA